MNSIDFLKTRAQERRNRAILWLRLCSGIKEVTSSPWKGIPIVLLCAGFMFVWNTRDALTPFRSDIPLLSTICGYLTAVFIPLLFLLLLVGVLLLLGTPFRAKAIEDSLLQIGFSSSYGFAPVLIARKRVKNTSVTVMAFYSLGIGMERWEKQGAEVQDALNIHFVESISYGGRNGRNRNIIVITAAPGAETRRGDTLYDDEI